MPDFIPVNSVDEVEDEYIVYQGNRYFLPGLQRQNGVSSDDESVESLKEDVCDIDTKVGRFGKLCSLNNDTLKVLQRKLDMRNSHMDRTIREIFQELEQLRKENIELKARMIRVEQEVI